MHAWLGWRMRHHHAACMHLAICGLDHHVRACRVLLLWAPSPHNTQATSRHALCSCGHCELLPSSAIPILTPTCPCLPAQDPARKRHLLRLWVALPQGLAWPLAPEYAEVYHTTEVSQVRDMVSWEHGRRLNSEGGGAGVPSLRLGTGHGRELDGSLLPAPHPVHIPRTCCDTGNKPAPIRRWASAVVCASRALRSAFPWRLSKQEHGQAGVPPLLAKLSLHMILLLCCEMEASLPTNRALPPHGPRHLEVMGDLQLFMACSCAGG